MIKKTKYILALSFWLLAFLLGRVEACFAQAPQGINYQAVARDNSGNPLATQTISIEFKIHQGAFNGTVVYDETYSKTTNQFGLFTALIGQGTVVSGTFNTITWGANSYWLEVFVNTFSMGSMQFVSVPYAFHAHTADSVKNISSLSPWSKSGGNIFPATLSDNVGIGLAVPSGKLSVLVTSTVSPTDAFNVGHQGLGHAGVFAQNNPQNDSATLVSYTNGKGAAVFGINMGTGYGGAFAINNSSSASSGILGSTNGTGKGIFGVNIGKGYAGAFMINNPANDSAGVAGITNGTIHSMGVYGINMGLGWGGFFQVYNSSNSNDALAGTTNGTGKAGSFSITNSGSSADALYSATNGSGNAAWFNGKIKITDGNQAANKVLTSDANGVATWQNPPGGGPNGGFSNMQVFSTASVIPTFTVSAGVTKIMVEVWGGGGGGAGSGSSNPTGGGGGGGYAKGIFNVSPLTILTVTVGAGGTAGPASSSGNGGNGGTSSISATSVLISASGGAGGNSSTGAGGVGGSSTAPFNITGGSGLYGGTSYISYGGAGANGGAGGLGGANTAGGAGIAPGGGGGGCFSGFTGTGGAGAPGRVVIWW